MKALAIINSCLLLTAAGVYAEETVLDVGNAFTCYFQNAGDNTYGSNSKYSEASIKDWTQEEMDAVYRALSMWDEAIATDPIRKIKVGFYWVDFFEVGGASGASAGGLASSQPTIELSMMPTSTVYKASTNTESLWRDKQLIYTPSNTYDICIYLNTRQLSSFYIGAGTDTNYHYDFQSVIAHEIGHNMGFASLAQKDGGFTQLSLTNATYYTAFDELMVGADGEKLLDKLKVDPEGKVFSIDENISLEGTELTVYNPFYWEAASSMNHVNGGDNLMYYSLQPGQVKRELSVAELNLMSAMGWQVIPEPSTATLSVVGLSALLFYRKRRS